MTEHATRVPFIDVHTAMRLLREVVAGYKRYVYEARSCRYVGDDNCPLCLIAQVLHRGGIPIDVLRWLDVLDQGIPITVDKVPEHVNWLSHDAAIVLRAAQVQQDRRQTWGLALAEAADVYRRLMRGS